MQYAPYPQGNTVLLCNILYEQRNPVIIKKMK